LDLNGYYVFIMNKHYVFIAGGIGITPFRSMLVALLEDNKQIPITLFYLAATDEEFIFEQELRQAEKELGITIIYVITGKAPDRWKGETGFFSASMLKRYVKNYRSSDYYLSGPQAMVLSYQSMLLQMNIGEDQIVVDSFTGYSSST